MDGPQSLYGELKGELEALANPLFGFAEQQVRKRGSFLPFGASLNRAREVALAGALPEQEVATGADVLSLLHAGLRTTAAGGATAAVAVCEWVKITLEDGSRTDAIKVLVEHVRGLTVAFYLPCQRRLLRGWQFGEIMVLPAEPEVRAWSGSKAV